MAPISHQLHRRIEAINVGLMVGVAVLAYCFPYGLLFAAYAFLGPAHYLTQIRWLHQNRYFVTLGTRPYIAVAVYAVILTLLFARLFDAALLGMFLVFSLALLLRHWALQLVVIVLGISACWIWRDARGMGMFLLLLPTFLHVFIFTSIFMIGGARRRGGAMAWLGVIVHLACITILLLLPQEAVEAAALPNQAGWHFFEPVALALGGLIGWHEPGAAQITALFSALSYAYAYHYLNWFAKVRIIGWHRVPRRDLGIIALLYGCAVGVYLYDYGIGLWALAFLSLLHVLLEFPLDGKAMLALLPNRRRVA